MFSLILKYSVGLVQAATLLVIIIMTAFHRKNCNASTVIYFLITTGTLLSCFLLQVQAHGNGAPNSRCETMLPGHWVEAQKSLSPYQILVDKTVITPGDRVNITLKTISGQTGFKGFFVMVKEVDAEEEMSESETRGSNKNQNQNYGIFDLASSDMSHSQPVHCFEQRNSAMTHVVNYVKDSVELFWIAPKLITGEDGNNMRNGHQKYMEKELRIVATFVKDFWTYWANVEPVGDVTLLLTDVHQPHGQQFSPKFQTPPPLPTQPPPKLRGSVLSASINPMVDRVAPEVPENREGILLSSAEGSGVSGLDGGSSSGWDHFKRAWNFVADFFGTSSSTAH